MPTILIPLGKNILHFQKKKCWRNSFSYLNSIEFPFGDCIVGWRIHQSGQLKLVAEFQRNTSCDAILAAYNRRSCSVENNNNTQITLVIIEFCSLILFIYSQILIFFLQIFSFEFSIDFSLFKNCMFCFDILICFCLNKISHMLLNKMRNMFSKLLTCIMMPICMVSFAIIFRHVLQKSLFVVYSAQYGKTIGILSLCTKTTEHNWVNRKCFT